MLGDRWRQKARREERRSELWKPFSKRLILTGIKIITNAVEKIVSDPSAMHSAIMSHWAPIFADKHVNSANMCACLDTVFERRDPVDLPVPSAEDLQTAAKLAHDSAPGPDGLPYKAWTATPNSFEISNNS